MSWIWYTSLKRQFKTVNQTKSDTGRPDVLNAHDLYAWDDYNV